MVDPKKEYELLMRYLQNGAAKRNSVTIPEPTYEDDWPPASQPTPEKTKVSHPVTEAPKTVTHLSFKLPHISWPAWKLPPFWKRIRIAIALGAILILVITTWKAYTFFTLTPESIYTKIYVPYTVTGNAQAVVPNSIEQYYREGNFVAATLKAKKQKKLSDKEQLLAGLAYLQRDDYTGAIKKLEPAANNFKSPYRQQAEYYLALAYLKNEDFDRCIVRMEHIAYTPSHLYHDAISKSTISDIKILKWK